MAGGVFLFNFLSENLRGFLSVFFRTFLTMRILWPLTLLLFGFLALSFAFLTKAGRKELSRNKAAFLTPLLLPFLIAILGAIFLGAGDTLWFVIVHFLLFLYVVALLYFARLFIQHKALRYFTLSYAVFFLYFTFWVMVMSEHVVSRNF